MSALIRNGNFIDGQWSSGGSTYPVLNPANGELIADVQKAGADETNRAIDAANRALPAWRKLTAKERSQKLKRWSELMLSNQKDLATLLSREQGKPLAEAMGEVVYAASFLEWFAEEAKRAYGDVIPSHKADARIIVVKEAIGVVAAITPWNFPLAMVTRKVGPALAAGCTMILKPSEETPLSAFALAVLAEQAGIPAGVFNVVSGDAVAIGGALQASGIVRKLSFTGSTRTGKLLMRQAADTLKKSRWNWVATHRSLSSTTPMWTPPSKAPWLRNSATPGRPAFASTASSFRTASTKPSPANSLKPLPRCGLAVRWRVKPSKAR